MAKERSNLFDGPGWKTFDFEQPMRRKPKRTILDELTTDAPFKLHLSERKPEAPETITLLVYCHENFIRKYGRKVHLEKLYINIPYNKMGLDLIFSKEGVHDKRNNTVSLKKGTPAIVTFTRTDKGFRDLETRKFIHSSSNSHTINGETYVSVLFHGEEKN